MLDRIRFIFQKDGKDFNYWLDKHFYAPGHYIFKGDRFFMMGWSQEPAEEYPGMPGPCWIIFFVHTERGYPLGDLFRMMPYELPYIAFMRGLRGKKDLKYYKWERLSNLCNMLVK